MAKKTTDPPLPKQFTASVAPGEVGILPNGFVKEVHALEKHLRMPVIALIQDGRSHFDILGRDVAAGLYNERGRGLVRGRKVALLVDSYGGDARSAFEIATLLKRYCGGFVAVVPRHAKSAATLLVLGAERIILAEFAELGPLDMQLDVTDREETISVLDEAQSLNHRARFSCTAS